MSISEEKLVLAIDQSTISSCTIIFDHSGEIVAVNQKEFIQIFPNPGWTEHDPVEIWGSVRAIIVSAPQKVKISASHLVAVDIANQREAAIVWDKNTDGPVYNVLVWQDVRTDDTTRGIAADDPLGAEHYRQITGENISAYPSATKVKRVPDNIEGVREHAEAGDLPFDTPDTWILWNLAGGVNDGVHATDVTNTSRTLLVDVRELKWREDICKDLGILMSMFPEIKPSAATYGKGHSNGLLAGVPISSILGDQQTATFGQAYFEPSATKNTYGTGCFTLINTDTEPVFSRNGLLTTVLYQLDDEAPVYTLKDSVAVAGSLVQRLRDNLGMIVKSSGIGTLAESVKDSGSVCFVPAFSGLFAPYWRSDTRGATVGLTRYVNKGHITRAVEKSAALQSAEFIGAMNANAGVPPKELKVDGDVAHDELLMQLQADISGCGVARPIVVGTITLGAVCTAGIAVGFWSSTEDVVTNWQEGKRWSPSIDKAERDRIYHLWKKAVTCTFDWIDEDVR